MVQKTWLHKNEIGKTNLMLENQLLVNDHTRRTALCGQDVKQSIFLAFYFLNPFVLEVFVGIKKTFT